MKWFMFVSILITCLSCTPAENITAIKEQAYQEGYLKGYTDKNTVVKNEPFIVKWPLVTPVTTPPLTKTPFWNEKLWRASVDYKKNGDDCCKQLEMLKAREEERRLHEWAQ